MGVVALKVGKGEAGVAARLDRLPRRDTNRLSGVWVCGCGGE